MVSRRGVARHDDFDVILAADFRAAGEAAELVASHLASLGALDLEIGLFWLRDAALPRTTPVNGRLARLIRQGAAVPIEVGPDPIRCRLLLLYRPDLVQCPLPLHANASLIVPARGLPQHGEAIAATTAVAARSRHEPIWCPSPPDAGTVAGSRLAGLKRLEGGLASFEPLAHWRTGRRPPADRKPVLGRLMRTDEDRLPATREALLHAYPDDPELELRFLGGEAALTTRVTPVPKSWRLLPVDSVLPLRFLSRLDFYVHYDDTPDGAVPRAALQAMTTGRLLVVPPALRPVLGDGPVYRTPEQVAETVKYIHAEPRFYERYRAEQDAALAQRFSPARFLELVREHVGRRRCRSRPPAPAMARRPILFYPTNGVGLGHVTRLLAIARRLPERFEPVFFTPCHALAVIEHQGFRAEYVPEPSHDETAPADHAKAMAPRLAAALRYYRPAAIVFDGNVPRDALLAACADYPAPSLWVRRGMWRGDPALARHLDLSRYFDAVIEPTEVAASADKGPTASAEDAPIAVPPVMMLDRAELLPPRAARAQLGLEPERPAVLVQLGSGSNNDIERHLDRLVDAGKALDLQMVVVEWLIRHNPVRRRGVRHLAAFPNARYFRAFELAVSAAGYNSFHELLHHGVPTLFLPNDAQRVDDQRARAAWAETKGAAVCVPRGGEHALAGYLEALLDPAFRRQLARRARIACPLNGAAAAARAIEQVVARG